MNEVWTIYILGDGSFVAEILRGVVRLSGEGSLAQIAAIGALIGLLISVWYGILNQGQQLPLHYVLLGFVAYLLVFTPKATVMVDELMPGVGNTAPQAYVIDDVPLGLAAIGSIISQMGYAITRRMETNFGGIDGEATVAQGGIGRSLEGILALRALTGPLPESAAEFANWRKTLSAYIADCTTAAIALGKSEASLFSNADPLTGIEYERGEWATTESFLTQPEGHTVTCAAAMEGLRGGQGALIGQVDTILQTAFLKSEGQGTPAGGLPSGQPAVNRYTVEAIRNSFLQLGSETAVDMQRYIAAYMIKGLWAEAITNGPLTTDEIAAQVMLQQAVEQRNIEAGAEEGLFRRIMRPMTAFFEGFTYALAPFMAFLLGLGAWGFKLFVKYLVLNLWVILWYPILSVVNLFTSTQLSGVMEVVEQGTGLTSVMGVVQFHQEASTWLGTAGTLAGAAPGLALMLLFGGAFSATYLAGRLRGNDTISENQASPEASRNDPVIRSMPMGTVSEQTGIQVAGAGVATTISAQQSMARSVSDAEKYSTSATASFAEQYASSLTSSSGSSAQQSAAVNRMVNNMLTHGSTEMDQVARSLGYTGSDDASFQRDFKDSVSNAAGIGSSGNNAAGNGRKNTSKGGKGGLMGVLGNMVNIKAEVAGQASEGISEGRRASLRQGIDSSSMENAYNQLATALTKSVQSSDIESMSQSLTDQQAESLQEAYQRSHSAMKEHAEALTMQESSGSAASTSVDKLAGAAINFSSERAAEIQQLGRKYGRSLGTDGEDAYQNNMNALYAQGMREDSKGTMATAAGLMTLAGMGNQVDMSSQGLTNAQRDLMVSRDDNMHSLVINDLMGGSGVTGQGDTQTEPQMPEKPGNQSAARVNSAPVGSSEFGNEIAQARSAADSVDARIASGGVQARDSIDNAATEIGNTFRQDKHHIDSDIGQDVLGPLASERAVERIKDLGSGLFGSKSDIDQHPAMQHINGMRPETGVTTRLATGDGDGSLGPAIDVSDAYYLSRVQYYQSENAQERSEAQSTSEFYRTAVEQAGFSGNWEQTPVSSTLDRLDTMAHVYVDRAKDQNEEFRQNRFQDGPLGAQQ